MICKVSDAHVGVHLAKSVADGGEVAAQVLHHVLDAAGVLQQVDALRVRVVVDRERPLDRLGKVPVRGGGGGGGTKTVSQLNSTLKQLFAIVCVLFCRPPHLLLGLLEALRHKVDLLEGGNETLLVAGGLWFKRPHACLI